MGTPLDKLGQLLEQFKADMYAEAWWQLYKVYKEMREEEAMKAITKATAQREGE